MLASDLTTIVNECCTDVLDSMYFTTVLDSSSESTPPPAPQPGEISFALRFQGQIHGSFGLTLGTPMARSLAANFLGEEEDALTDAELAEVAGELTNMLCGSIVSRIEGPTKFALSHPEPSGTVPAEPNILTSKLDTDNGILHTWIAIDPPVTSIDLVVDQLMQAAR
jgi:CheY-specific phosphatase CheX